MSSLDSLKKWYYQFMEKKNIRLSLLFVGIVYFGVHLFITWSISTDIILGLLLLTLSVFLYEYEKAGSSSFYFFIVSLIFLLVSNPFTSMILVVIAMYVCFRWMDHRRVSALTKIGKKSPSQLSGITHSNPRVEITIRGDRR